MPWSIGQTKYILALQESAAVGMADGYAQASGKVGVLNLHVSPGLGNALGVLYDSWRMKTPLLVTAGQQDQRYQLSEPVLWSELIPLMRMYAKWTWEPRNIKDLVTATAVRSRWLTPPTGMVFLSLQWMSCMAKGRPSYGRRRRLRPDCAPIAPLEAADALTPGQASDHRRRR